MAVNDLLIKLGFQVDHEQYAAADKAVSGLNLSVEKAAKKAVETNKKQQESLKALAKEYGETAKSAKRGSDEQIAALKLQNDTIKKLERTTGGYSTSVTKLRNEHNKLGGSFKEVDREGGKMFRGLAAGSGIMSGLGRNVAYASGAFIGAAGLLEAFKATTNEAETFQKAQLSLDVIIKKNNGNVEVANSLIQQWATHQHQFGVSITESTQELARAAALTGSVQAGMKAYDEALVISKATGKDFNAVMIAAAKANNGQTSALARYIGTLPKGITEQQLYIDVMKKFGGQAAANTSEHDKLTASVNNLKLKIGKELLPIEEKYMGELDRWLSKSQNQKKITDDVTGAIHLLTAGLKDAATVIKDVVIKPFKVLADVMGGTKTAAEGILIAIAAFKVTQGLALLIGGLKALRTALITADLLEAGLVNPIAAVAALAAVGIFVASRNHGAAPSTYSVPGKNNEHVEYQNGKYTLVTNVPIAAGRSGAIINKRTSITAKQAAKLTGGASNAAPSPVQGNALQGNLVNTAKGSLGNPYQYGGAPSLSKPTDCSGLMVAVFAKNGITLPRTSQAQYASAPIKNAKPLLPGDLVFSEGVHPGHVGLYIGNGQVLEDPHTGDHVKIVAISYFGWNGESARWWGGRSSTGGGKSGSHSGGASDPLGTPPPATTTTTKAKKAPAYHVPDALEASIRRAQEGFKLHPNKTTEGALDKLYKQEVSLLKSHGQLAKAASVQNEIDNADATLTKAIADHHRALIAAAAKKTAEELKKKKTALAAGAKALAAIQQAAKDAANKAMSSLADAYRQAMSDADKAFEAQTQKMLDAAAKQYFQNGALTPQEQALANFQTKQTSDSLDQALQNAQDQLSNDAATGSRQQVLADQQAIQSAKDAITENKLSIAATESRTEADRAYTAAVTKIQTDRQAQEDLMNKGFQDLIDQVTNGAVPAVGGFVALLNSYGISIHDDLVQVEQSTAAAQAAAAQASTFNQQNAPHATGGYGPGGNSGNAGQGTFSVHALGGSGTDYGPHWHLSGESGPEDYLFVPHSKGGIKLGGGGGDTHAIIVNFNGPVLGDKKKVANEIVDEIHRALIAKQKRNGTLGIK